ncbi:MAG: arylesterase [Acidobacteriota bacterium]|jgi:acyl-CoA thioesterase I
MFIRTVTLMLLLLASTGLAADPGRPVLLVLGDSLTAGYGLDPSQAYPAQLQKKIDAAGLDVEVVNAGLSGETSAGGARRVNWLLRRRVDILLLELGANDGLRGISLDSTRKNLQHIIDETHDRYPHAQVVIAGMLVPPNLGPDYSQRFRDLFRELAEKNQATLIPFLLEGVAGKPELNQADGIHPTPDGHKLVAENVWKVIRPLLLQLKASDS